KVIAADAHQDMLAERMRRERRILAQLRHPNIAQMYDGGVTAAGRPYLVMEYVEGERLDEWCDVRRLDVDARVRLFLDVCAAVEHVQDRLVVHRDLKPANLLVTEDGTVKLLDFGIAKAPAGEQLTDAGATSTRPFGLTPAYASPEQIRNQPATAATDVYALGIVLYELLTGTPPFPRSGDSFEMVRAVLETDPPPPSGAVIAEPAAVVRGGTPDHVRRALRGDLDAIVLHAIAKRPEERYQDARALREDLERFLSLQPVLARRAKRGYRLRKFARRHRTAVTAALVVGLGAGAVALALSTDAPRTELRAYDNLLRGDMYLAARTPADVLRAVEQYSAAARATPASAEPLFREAYAWLIYSDWGWQHPQMSAGAVLDSADALIGRGLAMEPRSAEGLLGLGYLRALRDPVRLDGALEAFEQSLAIDDDNVEAWHQYGQSLMVLGRFREAEQAYRRALALEPRRAMTLVPLGAMALYERRFDDARAWADSAVAVAPANSYARASRARILLAAGDTGAARAEARLATGVDQGHAVPVRATLVAVLAAAGDLDAARAVQAELVQAATDERYTPLGATSRAMAALAVGDTARAVELVTRARPRGAWLRFYLQAPQFDSWRNRPEVAQIFRSGTEG
ncbi:MAG TPA: protein kinase, partial [Longimicrobiales bacterium]|nr:protein kinase [Longimicrobiales bacterium]